MPKISVIVPVYNTEKYIEKCLDSILMQEYDNYEIIVVNDGSTDNSKKIIEKYEKKYPEKIKFFSKENGGLSDARNYGVSKAMGEYLCFIDSDDYIAKDLFKSLEKYIDNEIDLIKYKCILVDENYKEIEKIDGPNFECDTGEGGFNKLCFHDKLIEPAWLYLCRREYFIENNFEFPVNKYHEDFAIIPFMIISAKTVVSTDIYGYYYVQSANSITRNGNAEKTKKRAYDMLEHYDNLIKKLSEKNFQKITLDNFKVYISNCLILKFEELPKKYQKEYIKEIKKRKIIDNIKSKNIKQLIKKILLRINVKLYLKIR